MPSYIDLSHPVTNGMPVYQGDPPVKLMQQSTFFRDGFSDFHFSSGMHSGTHVDGPMHLTSSLTRMAELPLNCFAGSGFLVQAEGQQVIALPETTFHLLTHNSVVLFFTGFDQHWGNDHYFDHHPVLSEQTARLLVQKQVKMVGIDFPSPDYAPYNIHKILLDNQILILENLTNLATLLPYREFELLAFPLKMEADSAPVRVVARVE